MTGWGGGLRAAARPVHPVNPVENLLAPRVLLFSHASSKERRHLVKIRDPRSEARNKFEIRDPNAPKSLVLACFGFWILVIRVCFGFRVSDFELCLLAGLPLSMHASLGVLTKPTLTGFTGLTGWGGGLRAAARPVHPVNPVENLLTPRVLLEFLISRTRSRECTRAGRHTRGARVRT